MGMKMKIGSSFSHVSTTRPSSSPWKPTFKVIHRKLNVNVIPSKRQYILFAGTESQEPHNVTELDGFELELQDISDDDESSTDISYHSIGGAWGKPGFISFYGHAKRRKDQILLPNPEKNKDYLLWFVGPTILVASFIFPPLHLRQILYTIFEDSLLTDFLILFFMEALFYCGVAVFLVLTDHQRRCTDPLSVLADQKLTPHWRHWISSSTVLILSLIIPTVTMGFVWPWTGPAASAALVPYLAGIIVQFAFEQYARHVNSPSFYTIPIIFQVYRLHQLNRAAQLVTALSFSIRGAEMTLHNQAINGSLSTLLNVLQFLGILCIWSLSSFVMRYFPSPSTPEQ